MSTCAACAASFTKWSGRCDNCGEWNTIAEDAGIPAGTALQVQADRATAIAEAIAAAEPGDLVLIAGKGHEDYQILGTTKIHFDDREEAEKALRARPC